MSFHIDTIDNGQTSGISAPAGTKVLENAVIERAQDKGCCCGDNEENIWIRKYQAMTEAAEAARDKFIQEALDFKLDEVPKKQVEEMFNGEMWEGDDWMWLPSMDVDANGNVVLNIVVDENGNATFIDD